MKAKTVIGLNSGTSMDGIDAAVFKIELLSNSQVPSGDLPRLHIETISSRLQPFEPLFADKLKKLVASGKATLEEICLLNAALGELFAQAALNLLKVSNFSCQEVDLIGSHGQTIWHAPNASNFWGVSAKDTLQLADPAIIAARTGIPVIANFRTADIALGGQGAPLVSFADQVLFGQQGIATGVLNIGGIGNITIVDTHGKATMAFDTGPGNVLIDRAAYVLFGVPCDLNGERAGKGQINKSWLSELLLHPYFAKEPPKTTGRECFGDDFADQLIEQASQKGISPNDCLATLTALSAHSVARAYSAYVLPKIKLARLILGGGGAENARLVNELISAWPHPIEHFKHEHFGISTKFKEALLFALLAYTTDLGIPNNVPSCTGASRAVCLGQRVQL